MKPFLELKIVISFVIAIICKLIEGAPANSISTVPVMPWGGR